MKEMIKMDELVEKYWQGETSLEEEQLLQQHFKNNSAENGPEKALFTFFESEQANTYTKEVKMPKAKIRFLSPKVMSIAASLAILLAALWTFNQYNQSSNQTVIDDPEIAMQLTREAFALLNGKVELGEKAITDNIVHLDKTLIFKNL